jgi:hypothetical protein
MEKNLLSLSLTDMSFDNITSLKTPEVINLLLQKGGDFYYNNTTNLIIGLAFIALSVVIFIGENNYLTTSGNIIYLNCNNDNCSLGVQYSVDSITYKKEFTVESDYLRPDNNQVSISYESSYPNNSRLGSSNYNTIIYTMGGIGLFFICLWFYFSSEKSTKIDFNPSFDIYTKTSTPNGLYVVSKK